MSLRIKAIDVAKVSDRPLFFDANVLVYLFGPVATPSNQWLIEAYAMIFKHCLTQQSKLCVDVIVLSEFINRFLRIEYEKQVKNQGLDKNKYDFKRFRSTDEGIQAAQDIESVVKQKILKRFQIIGKLFTELDIAAIGLVNADFNDGLIVKTCKEHQCVLVTNDADFSGTDIDILTANSRLA